MHLLSSTIESLKWQEGDRVRRCRHEAMGWMDIAIEFGRGRAIAQFRGRKRSFLKNLGYRYIRHFLQLLQHRKGEIVEERSPCRRVTSNQCSNEYRSVK
ncbi:MAG: hypothetical protein KME17_09495 [Cyanosarcina radialis HA8281-LM2]|nr:hypothetical protein [Cyanosarcina radialis HA8281-LM2]